MAQQRQRYWKIHAKKDEEICSNVDDNTSSKIVKTKNTHWFAKTRNRRNPKEGIFFVCVLLGSVVCGLLTLFVWNKDESRVAHPDSSGLSAGHLRITIENNNSSINNHHVNCKESIDIDEKSQQLSSSSSLSLVPSNENPLNRKNDNNTKNNYKPRVFGYYFDSSFTSSRTLKVPKRLPVYDEDRYPSKRQVTPTSATKRMNDIQNSEHYTNNSQWFRLEPYKDQPECQPMHDWQDSSSPNHIISNCNTVHEVMVHDFEQQRNVYERQIRVIASGYFRNVWRIRDFDGQTPLIFKTLRMERLFGDWTLERHRIDARIMERMTSSPHILDVHAYCAQTSIVEFAPGGDIEHSLWKNTEENEPKPNLLERLRIAVQVAQGLADLHTYESRNGHSAMVHADIMTNQFVLTASGRFKLNDFNRAHFMYWNTTSPKNRTCPYYYPDYNAWTFRSPEEYRYSRQTEKIDVFSMGNLFYTLLTETYPFEKLEEDEGEKVVLKKILRGKKPPIPKDIRQSKDPIHETFLKAMNMCWEFEWRKRPSAVTVRNYLQSSLQTIEFNISQNKNSNNNTNSTEYWYDLSKLRFKPLENNDRR